MILIYIPLFILGFISGILYFWHMWKSIGTYGAAKNKILMSMVFRVPIPIGAALVSYLIGKFEGVIAVLIGFTAFQVIFLVKKGKQLKKQLEEELEKENKTSEK
ncbi:ATP synthase subunit I [Sulfurihydrogenibium subterraneum]|uniref:ATP synthase subunit I n=1 Tax=Sulfurihydrogenibium subterraneum TaxID=171121 RepID=UPI000B251219|nr:ATP synthase subunit I [Sulfurihydrogenibium subterraneum]